MEIYEVGQVAGYIKRVMECDELLGDLWVHGEISNFSRSPSGHVYFTLKDCQAQLRCALFRNSQRRGSAELRNGATIFAHGRVSFYEAQGACQLYVDVVQPDGVGMAHLQFEALRAKLEAEGLFAPERKRPLPRYPRHIGLVTSPNGAVFHDFVTIVGRRYPLVQISWVASSVQGEKAPAEVISGLNTLNQYHECGHPLDLIVIARGGGSMEDLSAFNHEGLARAIFASTVPVVSAIGHETDYSIADFVADLRAPTPSAAAEMVTPNVLDFRMQLANLRQGLIRSMEECLLAEKACVNQGLRQLEYCSPAAVLEARRRETEDAVMLASRTMVHRLQVSREQVRGSLQALTALSPYQTLERGYSLCFDRRSGRLVRSRTEVSAGDLLEIQVADGKISSVVTEPADAKDR